jgi:hypothetical protein
MPVRRAPRWGYPGARAAATCWTTLGYWPAVGTISISTLSDPDSADATGPIGELPTRSGTPAPCCYRRRVWLSSSPVWRRGDPGAAGRRGERDFAARRCPPPLLGYPHSARASVVLAGSAMGWRCPGYLGCAGSPGSCCFSPRRSRGLVTWVNPPQAGRTTAVQGRRCVRGVAYRAARVPTRPVGHLAVTHSPES